MVLSTVGTSARISNTGPFMFLPFFLLLLFKLIVRILIPKVDIRIIHTANIIGF